MLQGLSSARRKHLVGNLDGDNEALAFMFSGSLFSRLQDLSSGYWVLVVHFTRREAIKQIEVLQHVATNLGRSECLQALPRLSGQTSVWGHLAESMGRL